MMDKKIKKTVEKVLREFFKKLTFEVDFEVGELADNNLKLDLKTSEPQVLIGLHGETLHSLQMVLGRLIRKQLETPVFLDIDINQYKQNKMRYLQEMAKSAADRAALNRKEEVLPAMSSYERRIIHLALAERTDIKTESVGDGLERRVVIRPA